MAVGVSITRGNAGSLTQQLLGSAFGIAAYAQGRTASVDTFIQSLASQILSLQAPVIVPVFPVGTTAPAVAVAPPPGFDVPVWVAPGFPTALTEVLEVGDLDIAPFDDDPPVVSYGTAPAPFVGAIPDAPAINLVFDDPVLTVTLPPPPNLLSLTVEKFSGMTLPVFDAESPELLAVEPSIREYIPGALYTSRLLSATQAALEDRIVNGGTGLNQEVENAIWDRGREREARAQADAIAQLDQLETLGYALMPGIYLDARLKIITETDYAVRGHSREVMIKSAELELDNVKHALTTAVQLEGQLIAYTNAVETRIFESTKYATEAGIAIYNAKVQAYGALVQAYQGKVQVYEAQVRAEVAKVDAYRAQIAAEEAKASINRTLVEQYRIEVDVSLSAIEIFKARIAGIAAKAEIERTKVMVFGEQVRGFTAQVNAYTAGVEAFRATIQAEQAKQQVYQSQVEAFTARVNANARQIESRVEAYKGLITAKAAEYDGYRSAIAGESARVEAITKTSSVQAEAYKATVAGVSSYNEVLTKQWQAVLDQNQRTAEIAINTAKANAELYVTMRSLALDATKTGAQVAAQIGAAALNALSFSGSVSASEGYNASESVSNSSIDSDSNSNSHSENYNYNTSN